MGGDHTRGRPCDKGATEGYEESTGVTGSCRRREERPGPDSPSASRRKLPLLTPGGWTSGLLAGERLRFGCVRPPGLQCCYSSPGK